MYCMYVCMHVFLKVTHVCMHSANCIEGKANDSPAKQIHRPGEHGSHGRLRRTKLEPVFMGASKSRSGLRTYIP